MAIGHNSWLRSSLVSRYDHSTISSIPTHPSDPTAISPSFGLHLRYGTHTLSMPDENCPFPPPATDATHSSLLEQHPTHLRALYHPTLPTLTPHKIVKHLFSTASRCNPALQRALADWLVRTGVSTELRGELLTAFDLHCRRCANRAGLEEVEQVMRVILTRLRRVESELVAGCRLRWGWCVRLLVQPSVCSPRGTPLPSRLRSGLRLCDLSFFATPSHTLCPLAPLSVASRQAVSQAFSRRARPSVSRC